ncbi:MAG: T9SS type A sorting domain-containing protein, partial [Hymenobacter sp.]
PITLTSSSPLPTGTLPSATFNSGAPAGWAIGNAGAANTAWQYTLGNALTYAGGFNLTNFSVDGTRFAVALSDAGGASSVTNTTLTTPSFSTVGYSALSVSFQQVLVIASGAGLVEASIDGGTTWTTAATYYGGNTLAPSTATINLAGYLNQPDVRLRWHYTDTWGYLWALDSVTFTGTPATYTYAWSLVSGDGLPVTTNAASIVVTPTQSSVYRLTVGYTGGSCTASSTVAVETVTNSIEAYPVPFGDAGLSLRVSTCTAGPAAVQIYDIVGRRVYNSVVSTPPVGNTTVTIPEAGLLRPGNYVVKVQQGTQNTSFNVVRQ